MRRSEMTPRILLPLFALLLFGCWDDATGPAEDEADYQLIVVPEEVSIMPGQSVQLLALARDGQGRLLPLPPGDEVAWESSDPGVAEVTADGTVRALAEGRVSIKAGCKSYCAGAIVHVTYPYAPGR